MSATTPLLPSPTAADSAQNSVIAGLVKKVVEANDRRLEALRVGTSFTANPTPQLSPQHSQTHGSIGGNGNVSSNTTKHGVVIPPSGGISASPDTPGQLTNDTDDKRSSAGSDIGGAGRSVRSNDSVELPLGGSDPIVDLGKAAMELHLALGGSNYKDQAQTLLNALEGTLELIKDSAYLLKSMNLVPLNDVLKYAEPLYGLMTDAKEIFAAQGSNPTPRSDLLTPPYSNNPLSPARGLARGQTGASGGGQHQKQPVMVAEDELYDVTLLVSNVVTRSPGGVRAASGTPGGSAQVGRDQEVDDEMLALKSRIQSLSFQKKSLESAVERLEIQLKKQADSLSRETAAMRDQQLEIEKDLNWIQAQVDKGLWLPTYTGGSSPMKGGGGGVRASSPKSPLDSGNDPYPVPTAIQPNDVASYRANKMDVLYADTYRGRGLEMVWNALECVYKREFATNSASSAGQRPISASAEGSPTASNKGGNSPMLAKIGTPSDSGAGLANTTNYQNFLTQYRKKIGDVIDDQSRFMSQMVEITPLRSDYVANCLSSRLKPNSGVVRLLTTITSDESVEILNLHSNYIGDHGIAPIVPLLTRLYRLNELDLSDNGLKNGALHQLCAALQRHPTITKLNVSNNPITRSGGKDLLALASSCGNVHEIICTGTQIEPILQERIAHRTQLNRDSQKH